MFSGKALDFIPFSSSLVRPSLSGMIVQECCHSIVRLEVCLQKGPDYSCHVNNYMYRLQRMSRFTIRTTGGTAASRGATPQGTPGVRQTKILYLPCG
jgi:hypothetical protein